MNYSSCNTVFKDHSQKLDRNEQAIKNKAENKQAKYSEASLHVDKCKIFTKQIQLHSTPPPCSMYTMWDPRNHRASLYCVGVILRLEEGQEGARLVSPTGCKVKGNS